MYCRSCGNKIAENAVKCPKCGTRAGEGVEFCQNCGFHTNERTEFCLHCGAKQKNILPKKIKEDRVKTLQKQLKTRKNVVRVLRFVTIGSILIAVICFIMVVFRETPQNIPEPFVQYSLEWGTDSVSVPSDYMPYADRNVQEYWEQGRKLIGGMLLSIVVAIIAFIDLLIQKARYKRIQKALKEAKNVL